MVDAIISTILDVTLSKAISIAEEQINLQLGFKDELRKLRASLTMTHGFLQDAENRQVHHEVAVQVWLKELRQIALEADDVLDELAYEDLRRKVETQMRIKVSNFFSIPKNPVIFCFKMARTVKGINMSLKEIKNQAREYGLQQRVQSLPLLSKGSQTTDSVVDSSQVVGRDVDVSKIIDLLIASSTQKTFPIVSIVGMGGLGKTTLAKTVRRNERTKNYFNKIMWVCVSKSFDVQKILCEMLESLTRQTCNMKSRDAILNSIKIELEGKTYLLVLDDVWDEDIRTWEDLRSILLGINENKRSSILVTTRNENTAVVRDTPQENRYHLTTLTDDECWAIMKKRAFHNSLIPSELEVIGRDIARKCGGVPLVANVVGGTMSNKWDINEWKSLRDNTSWASLEKEGIVGVLKLSFDRLPSANLKQCFAYCSIFPKDFRLQKEQLIQLWMAEGFLQQVEGNSKLAYEDIGNEYFNNLLSNSLLHDAEKDKLGSIIGYKMHDLVHDLAQSIRNSETGNVSHSQLQNEFGGVKLWHSLFSKSSFFHIEADFKGLRVLSFCGAEIKSLPNSIGRLKHLRYFDISDTWIRSLPKSVTQLYHLQTLRLLDCWALERFPKRMKNLVNLKHLYINSVSLASDDQITCLTNLQTLPLFYFFGNEGHRVGFGYLSELSGELWIGALDYVGNKEEAQRAKIWEKKKLDKLTYAWEFSRDSYNNNEEVLEGLKPHENLKRLTIINYMGENNPSWLARKSVSSSFQHIHLEELNLDRCRKLKNFPTLGQYPKLRFLKINDLENVRCIGNEFYMNNDGGDKNKLVTLFPALERFTFKEMKELKDWLDVEPKVPMFPSLKKLRIEDCRTLSSVPAMSRFSSLEILFVNGCNSSSFIGNEVFPSSLKKLKLFRCSELNSIPSVEGGISFLQELRLHHCDKLRKIEEGLLASTILRSIDIFGCSNLTSFPLNPGSESLLELKLEWCDKLQEIGDGLSACTKLKELSIANCPNLIYVPSIHGFSFLLRLTLCGCHGLTSLPSGLGTCTSLQELNVSDCSNLKSIPEDILGCLPHLRKLTLGPFPEELGEFPGLSSIHNLSSSLEDLTLYGWDKLSFLPDQLQHLTALNRLDINGFRRMKTLPEWFGNLSSLRKFRIGNSENPHEEDLQRFSNLKKMVVTYYRRYRSTRPQFRRCI